MRSAGEGVDALGQARDFSRGGVFVNDALLGGAREARRGFAQRLGGGLGSLAAMASSTLPI